MKIFFSTKFAFNYSIWILFAWINTEIFEWKIKFHNKWRNIIFIEMVLRWLITYYWRFNENYLELSSVHCFDSKFNIILIEIGFMRIWTPKKSPSTELNINYCKRILIRNIEIDRISIRSSVNVNEQYSSRSQQTEKLCYILANNFGLQIVTIKCYFAQVPGIQYTNTHTHNVQCAMTSVLDWPSRH